MVNVDKGILNRITFDDEPDVENPPDGLRNEEFRFSSEGGQRETIEAPVHTPPGS